MSKLWPLCVTPCQSQCIALSLIYPFTIHFPAICCNTSYRCKDALHFSFQNLHSAVEYLSKGDTSHHCRCIHVIGVNMLFIVVANWLLVFTYTNRHCTFFRVAPTVDAVLLSHPDMMHLGALPYAMKHLGLSAPVYATEPVFRLGLLTIYDHFLSRWVSVMVLDIFLGRTLFNHSFKMPYSLLPSLPIC